MQKAKNMPVTNPIFPIKLVWTSSVFLLIGGGRYAAEMLLAAMIAKACNEETRYASQDTYGYGNYD